MSSFLAEQILRIFGFTIATYCEREEQSKLIALFPSIINDNHALKWKLFASQSLKHYIENTAIPVFRKTFNIKEDDKTDDNNNNNNNNNDDHAISNENDNDLPSTSDIHRDDNNKLLPKYNTLSLTKFNIKGICNKDIDDIYNESHIKDMTKSYKFESFKSFVIMLIIEQFYKQRFPDKIGKNTSMEFLDRNIVNEPIFDIIFNKDELKQKILQTFMEYDHFEDEEKGVILNVFQQNNEKFDFMLRVIKEINGKYEMDWFIKQLEDIKYHVYDDQNDSFFNDLTHRFDKNDEVNIREFCEMLNILFLSKMKLFNQWITIHSEEAFLSEIASKSFMTMDIDIVAITPHFDKVVMIQGLLKQFNLSFDFESCLLL